MGHYDSNYEEADRITRLHANDYNMKWRREGVNKLDSALSYLEHYEMPDRFKWAFEDYRRWLIEGLDEWERDNVVNKLKGK